MKINNKILIKVKIILILHKMIINNLLIKLKMMLYNLLIMILYNLLIMILDNLLIMIINNLLIKVKIILILNKVAKTIILNNYNQIF